MPPRLKDAPPVSVLIPCYNEGDNAEETLRHALALNYPDFEVIAINDGSRDNTREVLERLAAQHPRLRVVHLAQNQGKAMALQAGSLLARHEILIGIDGDALLDPHSAHWLVRHFVADARVAAVTGNPRIRNRSTLLGRVQVGEFSSIVGMIKRAQKNFGSLFTVSGVITAFRKAAVHDVGYWSADMLTEDIDITWKLQRAGWTVKFEPNALVWILMPETLRGLWKQRLRWATGGAQVLLKNFDVLWHPRQGFMWPLLLEMCASVARRRVAEHRFALYSPGQWPDSGRHLPAAIRVQQMAGQSLRARARPLLLLDHLVPAGILDHQHRLHCGRLPQRTGASGWQARTLGQP
jgi:biofilm PGA synthesis N-glycosyltransferase PgaC